MADDIPKLYADYFKSRNVEDMSAVDFFQFEDFLFKHRTRATQQWQQVVIPAIKKVNKRKAAVLKHEWQLKPQVRNNYWESKREDEEKASHLSAVRSEGRVQSLASVKSATAEIIDGLNPPTSNSTTANRKRKRKSRQEPLLNGRRTPPMLRSPSYDAGGLATTPVRP
ncbi:hypothetical protein BGZ65_003541, partial [Modicella reniformis]